MRLAFWRIWREGAVPKRGLSKVADAVAKPEMMTERPAVEKPLAEAGDLDLRLLGRALARKRGWIIVPTVLVLILSVAGVNMVTPRYKSEARILVDGSENVFLRPISGRMDERQVPDAEAITSQVQLVLSRDLAREIIKNNKLTERPEFDPVRRGMNPIKSLLILFGIGRDPFSLTAEQRVMEEYYDRLTVYAVDKSRVIVVEFQSWDPDLAARVANSIADGYLVLQQNARQDQAKSASQWLAGEIDRLRNKVSDAETRVEDFRSKSSLFVGINNTTLSNQQLGELNTQLNNARAMKADTEARARLIREMLQSGKPIEASEVLNSELMRRLTEQRVTLRAQLAEQSSTLLGNHPRIKELKAQLGDLDNQIRDEAGKISRSLENDVRIASGRVESLAASLDQLKKQASSTNGQDVQLRALEREAKAQRDLLESYLAKYREAGARENIDATPADGRIISRAVASNTPAYPKKLPIVLISTLATLLLGAGVVVTGELLRITAPGAMAALGPSPVVVPAPAAPGLSSVAEAAPARVPPPISTPMPTPKPDPSGRDAVVELISVAPQAGPVPERAVQGSAPDSTGTELVEVERLADKLHAGGWAARKVTVIGTASGEGITVTALTLARCLARQARVILVDLAATTAAIPAASVDSSAPGLAELMQGDASFAQIITKDRLSRLHLVTAGRPGFDRGPLQSPRVKLAIDALLRVYEYVVLNAGVASDLPAELLTTNARAIVVPDASMAPDALDRLGAQLGAVGFAEVVMLSKPVPPSVAMEAGLRMAAA